MGGGEAEEQDVIQEPLVVNATLGSSKTKRISKLSLGRRSNIHEAGTNNSESKVNVPADRDITDGHHPWNKGSLVCVPGLQSNRVNANKKCYVFGILAASVPSESKTLTCVMQDGTYRAFTYSQFAKGVERMRKEPFATRCPVSRLQGWLRDKSARPCIFKAELEECQEQFLTQKESGVNVVKDKTVMTPQREQLVIEVLSESDDDITRNQQVHVKPEVQVKVEPSAMAEMQKQMAKMEKIMDALLPRPPQRLPKAPKKKTMPSAATLQSQIGSSDDGLSDSYSWLRY